MTKCRYCLCEGRQTGEHGSYSGNIFKFPQNDDDSGYKSYCWLIKTTLWSFLVH